MNRGAVAASIVLAGLVAGGCAVGEVSRESAPAEATASTSLSPVVLPDISPLAESVQRQMRERYADLQRALEHEAASAADRAAAYGDFGRVLMASAFNDEAAVCYAHAEALAGADMRWPYLLGHAYLRSGDRERAAAAFERAAGLAPDDIRALVWLGETYLDDGRSDAALSAFTRALSLQPQSPAALFGAGRAALAQGASTDAIDFMERALAADRTATAIHYPLAMAYRAAGDRPKADAHLRLRGSVFPALPDPLLVPDDQVLDSAVAYEDRGMQSLRQGDWASAEAAFRRGLELAPQDATLRYWLGATLYAAGNPAGAEQEFLTVVRQSPDFARAHFSLGAIYEARGQRPAAIDAYRAAVANDPTLPEARLRLAELLRLSGEVEASLTEYEAAVRLDPGMAQAWVGGAQVLRALGRDSEAERWTTQARRLGGGRGG